eukprot:scaffold44478_cov57-Phaeocystis_antarctica.AAC.1
MASRAISAAPGACASDQLASSASPPLDTSASLRSSQSSGPDDAEMSLAPSAQGPCTVAQGHVHERARDLSLDEVVRLAHAALAHEQGAAGVRRRPDCVWHSAEEVVATVRVAALHGGAQRVQVGRWLVVRVCIVARKRLRPQVLPGPACTGVVLLRAVGAAVSVEQPDVGRGSRVGIGLLEDVPCVGAAARVREACVAHQLLPQLGAGRTRC